jgi:hypothetical protein
MGKKRVQNKSDVLSASEIGRYCYCSYAWFLQRCGYEAESPFLEPGAKAHIALGDTIDGFETRVRHARWYALVGLLTLCIAFLLFFLGVIL